MSAAEEKNKFLKLLISQQETCQNSDPETCDVCLMLDLLIDEVNK